MGKKIKPKNVGQGPSPFMILVVMAFVGAGFTWYGSDDSIFNKIEKKDISLTELLAAYENNEFESIKIKDEKITGKLKNEEKFLSAYKESSSNIKDLGFLDGNSETKIEIISTESSKMWMNFLLGFMPLLILIFIVMFFMKKMSKGGDGGPFGFGRSKAKTYDKTKHKTKFADVAGAEEAKEDVVEVVDFLKNPKKYQKAGAKIPKGILMVGPPGTGKTLMARAIAGEAGVPFFSVSGSEFVEMFVGVGASRVRDLFKTAKKNSPAIIFIDEIDAIGKQRGTGGSGGHSEQEQTLNQILTEMDGFEPETSVIVIAATNRPDILDKALLRPGRFDRRVQIDLPDMNAREKILEVHTNGKKINEDVNLKLIASKTVGFSGADLQNIMNEGAIASVKGKQKNITQKNLDEAIEKISIGAARKSRRITDKEKEIIAYHEVGHALTGHATENCEPVHKISIIARGGALGVTWFLPVEDTYLQSESKMKDEMISLHGGRMAEKLIFGEKTTGASNDLERITAMARAMVMTYGMGDDTTIGPVVFQKKSRGFSGVFSDDNGDHSEAMAQAIDMEVKKLVQEAETKAMEILVKQKDLLHEISKDLLKKEDISREEFLAYFK